MPSPSGVTGSDRPLATLGGKVLRESDFEQFLRAAFSPEQVVQVHSQSDARHEAMEAWLDLMVQAAKARKDGIDQLLTFQKARELMQMKLLVRALTDQNRARLIKAVDIADAEIERYYAANTNLFQVPPGFTAREIQVYVQGNPAFPELGLEDAAARARAAEAAEQLRQGKSWAEVAGAYSDDRGTKNSGGLIRNGQFGQHAKEMEDAVWKQELGEVGDPVKSILGYHVIQVERRVKPGEREPLAKVRSDIATQIAAVKSSRSQVAYLQGLKAELKFQQTSAARPEASLLDTNAVAPDAIIAVIRAAKISEADFHWFLKDAFRAEQRRSAFSRPGARAQLLASFFDLRVLEAEARKEGLDKTPAYERDCSLMEMRLLAEFLQERDGTAPWKLPGATEEERMKAFRAYLGQLRIEMGLQERLVPPTSSK